MIKCVLKLYNFSALGVFSYECFIFVLAQNLEVYELKLFVVSWFVLVVRKIWFLTVNTLRKQYIKLKRFSFIERFYY